jgi:hypothetical protein
MKVVIIILRGEVILESFECHGFIVDVPHSIWLTEHELVEWDIVSVKPINGNLPKLIETDINVVESRAHMARS